MCSDPPSETGPRRPGRRRWTGWAVLAGLLLAAEAAAGADPGSAEAAGVPAAAGVVVEEVAPGSLGERAGLLPGDVLTGWWRPGAAPANPGPAAGLLLSPFDLQAAFVEQAPRGALQLFGTRGSAAWSWTLLGGAAIEQVAVETRPLLAADLLALHEESKSLLAAQQGIPAAALWQSAAERASARGEGRTALWFLARRALALARLRLWAEADAAFEGAVAALTLADERMAAALLLEEWAYVANRRTQWERALGLHERALQLLAAGPETSLARARVLCGRGESLRRWEKYAAAQEVLRQSLGRHEVLAPESLDVARTLYELARAVSDSGDDAAAEILATRGEGLLRRLAPGSLLHARSLDLLGAVRFYRDDRAGAVRAFEESLALARRREPLGQDSARALLHLGVAARLDDDLPLAEEYLREALAIWQTLPPDSATLYNLASNLSQLAFLTGAQGDLSAGRAYGRQALEIQEKLDPTSRGVADALDALASVAHRAGDAAAARRDLTRAVALREKLPADKISLALTLALLGHVEVTSGEDLDRAEEALRRARHLLDEIKPLGLFQAEVLSDWSRLAAARNRPEEALELIRQALEIRGKLTPGNIGEAADLRWLGQLEWRLGRLAEGAEHQCRAADIVDDVRNRLDGRESLRSQFLASHGEYYAGCISARFHQDRQREAFHLLERGRARSLLDLMATRPLEPPELPADLKARRGQLRSEYERISAILAGLGLGQDAARVEELLGQLREIRRRQEALTQEIWSASPRFAALKHPHPLDLDGARGALDPGTALLAYVMGEQEVFLFVVRPEGGGSPGFAAFRLPVAAGPLRAEVEAFRSLLRDPGSPPRALGARARALYRRLIQPAESAIAPAERLLIAPDGILHTLPFAALRRRDGRYLVEWKPVHTVISATVYAELRQRRNLRLPRPEPRVAAFGDPVYPRWSGRQAEDAADLHLRSALRRGLSLAPLPWTRSEVEALGRLYPQARLYLDREATEENAKALDRAVEIVHFAGHALLDEALPLNSALALTIPEHPAAGRDNGLLQIWEIFEQVRLDADLVVLSACSTALGRETAGEGLVGLTRAFQFAGARSVLASLWEIDDGSTALFMPDFYRHLRDGRTKDEALRLAQLGWIRSAARAHPFYWAAFQLVGDHR